MTASGPPSPMPHRHALRAADGTASAAEDGDAGSERRRKRRRRGQGSRRRLMPVLALGAAVAAVGAVVGVGGGWGLVILLKTERTAEMRAAQDSFMGYCSAGLSNIDCGCLWEDAGSAIAMEHHAPVIQLIAERRDLPVRLQRIRSEKLLGADLAKQVWEAAYYCARR